MRRCRPIRRSRSSLTTARWCIRCRAAPIPTTVDYDTFVYALKAGYGRRGAKIGSQGDDAEAFRADMIEFWSATMAEGSR